MDIKIKGLKYEILVEALHQAKKGRLEILDKLDESINKPNETVKAHAPKMVTMEIPKGFHWCSYRSWWKNDTTTPKRK